MSTPARRSPSRGWPGPGGGAVPVLQTPPEWRATTVQACGLWPFGAGSGTPMIGVPLGRSLITGAAVCCDPISWFTRAKLINNPSVAVLGEPGLGKSTLMRRMCLGLEGYGVHPMIFGDLKPDYVDLIEALDGQVITLGRGRGSLNILDPGEAATAADRLTGRAREAMLADIHARRLNMVSALVTILRSDPPTDREETIVDTALRVLDDRHDDGVPVLADLLQVIRDAPDAVRAVALDRGDLSRYQDITEALESSLQAILQGRLGEVFARPTTVQMRLDRPVCFDVSSIDDSDDLLQAAALLACWSYGFSSVGAVHALADAGLAPRQNHFVVMDELWRVLRAGRGLVNRVDALTRLNRQRGVGSAIITHTMKDFLALPSEEDRMKAVGFVERSGLVICGGLPREEMPRLQQVMDLSRIEQDTISAWSTPPSWTTEQGADPPGRGNFMVKVGGMPGIPLQVQLTSREIAVNDTNKRWAA